jgi:hypothetical protein
VVTAITTTAMHKPRLTWPMFGASLSRASLGLMSILFLAVAGAPRDLTARARTLRSITMGEPGSGAAFLRLAGGDQPQGWYLGRRNGGSVCLTKAGFALGLGGCGRQAEQATRSARSNRIVVRCGFGGGARAVEPEGEVRARTRYSFFGGPRSTWGECAAFSSLRYRRVWPGIDVVCRADAREFKYEFHLQPGADPARIVLQYEDADSVNLNSDGSLTITTAAGSVEDAAPYAYQETPAGRQPVAAAYHLVGDRSTRYTVRFALGSYDTSRSLVIDPAVLDYCGLVRGNDDMIGSACAVDAQGGL